MIYPAGLGWLRVGRNGTIDHDHVLWQRSSGRLTHTSLHAGTLLGS
jgi:hypothetical protein